MTAKLHSLTSPLNRGPQITSSPNLLAVKMDRTQKIASFRRTILMQEEMFRNQVKELHRIYNLQKKLMNELESEAKRRNDVTEQTKTAANFFRAREDPRELSGSCSGESSRVPIRFDFERASEKNKECMDIVDERKELNRVDEEADVEVELTLSIGRCTRSKRPRSPLTNKSACPRKVHDEESGDDPRRHWLLQDLSLNKT